jgi:hypothetical protein
MQQLTLKDPFKQVLVLWREHRKKISQEIKKSRRDETRLRSIGQKIRLIVWGSVLLALGITILALLGHFQRIFGVSAARVVLILMAWTLVCMVFLALRELPSIWRSFFRVMDGLFAAAGTWYQRDKPFVQALADNRDLDPSVIARRLKGEIEFREKLSAFLVIIAGGASFSGLGAIWDSLVKGHPNPWVILPTAGLAMTTILLQTLFIAARIKGDLLVCLEEAEELRKRRHNHPAARVDKLQSHGMTSVIKGRFIS